MRMKDNSPRTLENLLLVGGAVAVAGIAIAFSLTSLSVEYACKGYQKIRDSYSKKPDYQK